MTCLECSPLGFFLEPWKLSIFLGSFLIAFFFIKKIKNSKEINKKLKYIYLHIFFLISPIVFFIFFNGCESIYAKCNKPAVVLGILVISAITSLILVLLTAPFLILKYYRKKSFNANNNLLNIVKKYSETLSIKQLRLFILDSAKPKAFSFSYFFNAVFLSVGLIELLNYNELKAVILHELSHIKQRSPLLKFSSLLLKISSPLAGFSSLISELDKHEDEADKLAISIQNTNKHMLSAKRKIRNYLEEK